MAKYTVVCFIPVCLTIAVDAEDEDSAIDVALMEHAKITNYVGNGERGGKLFGTSDGCVTIEVCEGILDEGGWAPTATLTDEGEDDGENE